MDFLENEALAKSCEPISGNLYIIGTPIGNLGDLSPRAQSILQKVSLIACEDTRHSGMLLKKLKIKNNLLSFHNHNTQSRIPALLKSLHEGNSPSQKVLTQLQARNMGIMVPIKLSQYFPLSFKRKTFGFYELILFT